MSVTSSGRDSMISPYLIILDNFVRLILLDGFWIVHITICSHVLISNSCTISSGSLAHLAMSCLKLFVRLFTAFGYYMIDRFISITTSLSLSLSLSFSLFSLLPIFLASKLIFSHSFILTQWSIRTVKNTFYQN